MITSPPDPSGGRFADVAKGEPRVNSPRTGWFEPSRRHEGETRMFPPHEGEYTFPPDDRDPERETPVYIPPPPKVPEIPEYAGFLLSDFVPVVGAILSVPFIAGAAMYWWQLGGTLGLETWGLSAVPAAVLGACLGRCLR